jgi:hypothetical protein
MSRGGLSPIASPTNQFYRPEVRQTADSDQLLQVANELSKIEPTIGRIADRQFAAHQEGSALRAEADRVSNQIDNMEKFRDAVKKGQLREVDNPWYMVQMEQSVGRVEAAAAVQKLEADYENSPVRMSNDPSAVRAWAKDYISKVGTDGTTFSRAAMAPVLEAGVLRLVTAHNQIRSREREIERQDAFMAEAGKILEMNPDPMTAGKSLAALFEEHKMTVTPAKLNAWLKQALYDQARLEGTTDRIAAIMGEIVTPGGKMGDAAGTKIELQNLENDLADQSERAILRAERAENRRTELQAKSIIQRWNSAGQGKTPGEILTMNMAELDQQFPEIKEALVKHYSSLSSQLFAIEEQSKNKANDEAREKISLLKGELVKLSPFITGQPLTLEQQSRRWTMMQVINGLTGGPEALTNFLSAEQQYDNFNRKPMDNETRIHVERLFADGKMTLEVADELFKSKRVTEVNEQNMILGRLARDEHDPRRLQQDEQAAALSSVEPILEGIAGEDVNTDWTLNNKVKQVVREVQGDIIRQLGDLDVELLPDKSIPRSEIQRRRNEIVKAALEKGKAALAKPAEAPAEKPAAPTENAPKEVTESPLWKSIAAVDPNLAEVRGSLGEVFEFFRNTDLPGAPRPQFPDQSLIAFKDRTAQGGTVGFSFAGSRSNPTAIDALQHARDLRGQDRDITPDDRERGLFELRAMDATARTMKPAYQAAMNRYRNNLPPNPGDRDAVKDYLTYTYRIARYRQQFGFSIDEVLRMKDPKAWKNALIYASERELRARKVKDAKTLGLSESQMKEFITAQQELLYQTRKVQ